MLRRFNYTNRLRIARSDVRVSVVKDDAGLAFQADLSALPSYGLPPDAWVCVEAYRQTNWMRFEFGRVGAIQAPSDVRLRIFDTPEGIRFRVKVTKPGDEHLLLAEADGIPLALPEHDEQRRESLLPVKPADLDGEVYRLDLAGSYPVLEISRKAGAPSEIGRSPAFVSLVYPAVLREILNRVLVIEKHDDDDSLTDWRSRWLRFAGSIPGARERPSIDSDEETKFEWINEIVSAFARKIRVHERFAEFWKEGA